MCRDRYAHGRIATRDLLHGERVGQSVNAGTAILFGDGQPEEPKVRQFRNDVIGEFPETVVVLCPRSDLVIRELASEVAYCSLLIRKVKVQKSCSLTPVDLRREGGNHFEEIADDGQIGELKDRRIRIAIDRDNRVGGLHSDSMLYRS